MVLNQKQKRGSQSVTAALLHCGAVDIDFLSANKATASFSNGASCYAARVYQGLEHFSMAMWHLIFNMFLHPAAIVRCHVM